jgi:hypothetical protein
MHLSGQLADWSINDLLQIMQVTKKTGSLDVDGERNGRIHFRDGKVTGAELTGLDNSFSGTDRGGVADVLYVLSIVKEGSFAVGAADGPDTSGWSVEDVLADVEALKSLESEVIDAGLFESKGIRLTGEIAEPITIAPDDWITLASLVAPFDFHDLETRIGRGGTVRLLHTLHRLGVADVASDEEESDWLDRVADDVSSASDDPIWSEDVPEQAQDAAPADAEEDLTEESSSDPSEDEPAPAPDTDEKEPAEVQGVSAPASTTLTDGVYDEIRRLRSKVAEK